jgi:hypothetical protein
MQSWLEETEDEVHAARERDHPAIRGLACQGTEGRDRINDEYEKEEASVRQ